MATWLNYTRDLGPTSNLDGYSSSVPNGGNPYGNQMAGIVNHSAEGYFGTGNPSSVMRARGNSWHFTVLKNGKVWQHYPLEAMCWHAGSKANYRYIGIEHEGKAGEALTTAQLAATIKLNAAIARNRGWVSIKRGVTGFQHNDFMATSCPSGRIPWSKIEAGTKVAAPTVPVGIWSDVKQISLSVTLQEPTYLVKLPDRAAVKLLAKGTKLSVKGLWHDTYYITPYSFDKKIANGFAKSATINKEDDMNEEAINALIQKRIEEHVKKVQHFGSNYPFVWQQITDNIKGLNSRLIQEIKALIKGVSVTPEEARTIAQEEDRKQKITK